jgi:hypothetical protein
MAGCFGSTGEAAEAQQDTINRIVKFLAGVFGQHVNSGGGGSPGVAAGQHGKEDGLDGAFWNEEENEFAKTDGPKKNVIEHLNEIPLDDPSMFDTSKSFFENPILFPIFSCI